MYKLNMMIRRGLTYCIFAMVMCSAFPAMAADDIKDTFTKAYYFSPNLKAAKERLNVEKQRIPGALTGFQPNISLDYATGRQKNVVDGTKIHEDVNNGSLNIDQPIFDGFETVYALKGAKAAVAAAEYSYLDSEQNIFLGAAEAHINVVRDQMLVNLSKENHRVHKRQLKDTLKRFELGDLTKTDVAQAKARLAGAKAEVSSAKGRLSVSRTIYKEIVGEYPALLESPERLPEVPENLESALEYSITNHPEVLAANFTQEVAEKAVNEAKGDLWPSVFLRGRMERDNNASTNSVTDIENDSVTINFRVPIYEAGTTQNEITTARYTYQQSIHETMAKKVNIKKQVIENWEELNTSASLIISRKDVVDSAKVTVEGYQKEYDLGQRTTIDVLDAKRDFFDAQEALIIAASDYTRFRFRLADALGKLTATGLSIDTLEN